MIKYTLHQCIRRSCTLEDNGNKKKRFRLFDSQREGKGVEKTDIEQKPNLKRFFRLYRTNLGKLLSLNILIVLGNFPILFAVLAMSDILMESFMTPMSDLYPLLRAVLLSKETLSPTDLITVGIDGLLVADSVRTVWNYVFLGISLLDVFLFGIVNVGVAYVTRNIIMGDPVFVFSDFFYAIKRNWKQALPFGIVDFLICLILPLNIVTLMTNEMSFLNSFFLWTNIVIAVLYCFMRFYFYVQMVTFDLKIKKLIKNSLIFSLLGFKRNILALLGIFLLVILNLLFLYSFNGMLLPLGVAFPFLILFSHGSFMATYASYYKIKEIMIDPYQDEDEEETDTALPAPEDAE